MTLQPTITLNSWESRALEYEFPRDRYTNPDTIFLSTTKPLSKPASPTPVWRKMQDPIIYPGLYSASGFDIMSVLLKVMSRPHPTVELGAIDCSVAVILCDLQDPDVPIIYASDSFCELTGYARDEVLGRNCRFLQQNPTKHNPRVPRADKLAISQMNQAVVNRKEIQIEVTNYKKSGQQFTNVLSIIPVDPLPNGDYRYAVGFQVELES